MYTNGTFNYTIIEIIHVTTLTIIISCVALVQRLSHKIIHFLNKALNF